jgi:hypothetical protein
MNWLSFYINSFTLRVTFTIVNYKTMPGDSSQKYLKCFVRFTPAAESHACVPKRTPSCRHGLWQRINAQSFGRPVPTSDGGCRPTGAMGRFHACVLKRTSALKHGLARGAPLSRVGFIYETNQSFLCEVPLDPNDDGGYRELSLEECRSHLSS